MSRYIDAEYVKAVMINDRLMQGNAEINLYMQQVETQVKAMPSIDIVRCKECKWAKANGTYQWCGRLDSTARITADDYCSYGEREDE